VLSAFYLHALQFCFIVFITYMPTMLCWCIFRTEALAGVREDEKFVQLNLKDVDDQDFFKVCVYGMFVNVCMCVCAGMYVFVLVCVVS
jgi:hypothetical protein